MALSNIASRIEESAVSTFEREIDPRSSMAEIARKAGSYAKVDDTLHDIVIDSRSLIQALLDQAPQIKDFSAIWFNNAFKNAGPGAARSELAIIQKSSVAGYTWTLSESVRIRIIPRAKLAALLTSGKSLFGLSHLLIALLHEPTMTWFGAGLAVSKDSLIQARASLVEIIGANLEPDENQDIWRALITLSPEDVQQQQVDAPASKPAPQKRKTRISATDALPQRSPAREAVPIHTDDPAIVDLLGREGFATVMADRIIEARQRVHDEAEAATDEDDNRAFIVHMHGPWGSGKSTVLNFIRRRLQKEDPSWLVVEFNAWRSQRLVPPWWSLILAVQKAALAGNKRGFLGRRVFAFQWHWMRVRADYVPMIWGVILLLLTGLMLWYFLGLPWLGAKESTEAVKAGVLGTFKEVSAGIIGLVTGIGAVLTFGRSLLFGSGSAAKAYEELRNDPYTPMMTLFTRLVRAIDRPIIVFIDDLDRCERAYVCDLLENIQTMLRAAPITYLIAADRKWITTSFEKRYADFAALGTDAGRPLGYQFLDKLFQVSATLPLIPHALREDFWNGLLRAPRAGAQPMLKVDRSLAEAKAKVAVAQADSFEQLQAAARAESDPMVQQAIRAEGARKISTVEATGETEHRLKPLGRLIEANPRAMKRLANAVAMNLARLQIEGRDDVSFEAAARWTIVSLRWPLLADWLCVDVDRVSGKAPATPFAGHDETMSQLLADPDVQAVIGAVRAKGRLTPQSLAALIS